MNSKRSLMTVLVGLAMLATPIAAAAKDHNYNNSHAARVARSFSGRNVAPAVVTGHDFRNGSIARHDWRENRAWENANAYSNYGNRGYYGAPAYVAAPVYSGYGGGYGGGNGCGNAQRIMNTYSRDRATGHPAAAADLLRQNQWALHSGCASGATYGGGLLGGLGGLGGYRGAPAYNNYGGGYGNGGLLGGLTGYRGAPAYNNGGGYGNGGLLGGLGGYRGAPAYNNGGGYNTGYGQPNGGGSMLAPLMQYIR
jgi:hypothetical protein